MLQQTFIHLPGVGEVNEQRLWRAGVRSWQDFVAGHEAGKFRGRRIERAIAQVQESIVRYAQSEWSFFDGVIPSPHKWRAFADLGKSALYVDIETTGMGGADDITVIGLYDGREVRSYVAGINLEEAVAQIEAHPLVVTFNGAQFDMPIIRRHFGRASFNHVHVDLRFPLRRLGYQGGLKKIEDMFGIQRSSRTRGLDGWDAVRLWHEYQRGSRGALEVLVEYNREDICNLEPLMRFVFDEMKKRSGIGSAVGAKP